METRLNELRPYMKRLHHLFDLSKEQVEMITRPTPRVLGFKAKDARHDSDPR